MTTDRNYTELLDLYTHPERYYLVEILSEECGSEPPKIIRLCEKKRSIRRTNGSLEVITIIQGDEAQSEPQTVIVTIPMNERALERCRDIQRLFASTSGDLFTSYKLSRWRVQSRTLSGGDLDPYVAIQTAPIGEMLSDIVASANRPTIETLYSSISRLESSMQELNLGFKSLAPDGVIVGKNSLLYPQRLIEFGVCPIKQSDTSLYDSLRSWLFEVSGIKEGNERDEESIEDINYAVIPSKVFDNHLWCGYPHEERIAVLDEGGYGFVDRENRVVVEPNYLEVEDFREGRAVVRLESGFGVIDIDGNYILQPTYTSLGYNADTGVIYAREGELWGYFNYRGEQLTPFEFATLNEDISTSELAEYQLKREVALV